MADVQSKTEKWAQNAVLTLIARGLMTLASIALIPAGGALIDMRSDVKLMRVDLSSKISQVEMRLTSRIETNERRNLDQDQRMTAGEHRMDELTSNVNKLITSTAVLVERIDYLIKGNPPKSGGAK